MFLWTTKINKVKKNLEKKIELPIPIVWENEFQVNFSVMGYREYWKIWIPKNSELLLADMEPKRIVDNGLRWWKWIKQLLSVISQREKQGDFQIQFCTFFKSKGTIAELKFQILKLWWIGMRVPCTLHFHGDFIDILSNKLCKHNWWCSYITWYNFKQNIELFLPPA